MSFRDYYAYVRRCAKELFEDLGCKEWIRKHFLDSLTGELNFSTFADSRAGDGVYVTDVIHEQVDSNFTNRWNNWRGAVGVLTSTRTDPRNIDPGMYEGVKEWERLLIIIAYCCFEQDVEIEFERLFETDVDRVLRRKRGVR